MSDIGASAMIRALAFLVSLCIASMARAETYAFPSSMPNATALKIEGSGDIEAIEPLIRDFQSLNPTTAITYVDTLTNDLFTRVSEACARGAPIADLVFSSSVDHMVKLANDGCAAPHASADTATLVHDDDSGPCVRELAGGEQSGDAGTDDHDDRGWQGVRHGQESITS